MASSGITRRIDELGRIVVPKEIRYNLGIRDGEPLEITVQDGAIIIKKYSEVENIKDISDKYCKLINDVCNVEIIITDREKIIASSNYLKELINIKLGEKHKKLIDNRESYISDNEENMFDISGYFTIIPIITSVDCSGLIFIINKEKSDVNLKYAKIVQKLIIQKIDAT